MDPIFLAALAVGLVLVGGVVVLVVATRRAGVRRAGQRPPAIDVPRLPPAQCWQAAAPSLEALGLSKLEAECYRRELDGLSQTPFVSVDVRAATVRGWLDRPCPGGVLEQFLGVQATLKPGERGGSALERFVAGAVGEMFGALPRAARLSVTAPEIPGDSYKTSLSTPFTAPDQAALVARVLLALDEAARSPAPAGARAALPPVAVCWQAAAPLLEALGLTKLEAECYRRELDGLSQTLFVSVDVRAATVRGWLDRPCAGGVLEQFLGVQATLKPGERGGSALERFVAGAVGEMFGALPRAARLSVTAPEIPGDSYKTSLSTPFTVPDQAALVARVLLALDEAARSPAPARGVAHLPPVAVCWQAAAPLLEALGLTRLEAECYRVELGSLSQTLFVAVDIGNASVRGWLARPCPGGSPERHLGAEAELQPGERGRSELARFVAGAVGEVLGALPRAARLSVRAPEIAGDSCRMSLSTPFTVPDQAATVARVLLALDEAARRPVG